MFKDRVVICLRSGNGGDGCVSFRRELYVAAGGPDGGDGGRGGDIILEVDKGLNTLSDYRYKQKFAAQNGEPGRKRRCHGKNGADLVLKVPEGTVVLEEATGKVITDMSGANQREVLLKGGRGGQGNTHYATATMQVPKYAQPGKPGQELNVILELKVIADVGLVGYPNVGKSTLLSRVSRATPKIGNYHFTTLDPHLGVVSLGGSRSFVMADIPGLIEGAAQGAGLGHEFLRHIERTRLLIHLVDGISLEGRDPVEDIRSINKELEEYDPALLELPQIIAANKMDADPSQAEEVKTRLMENFPDTPVFLISAVSGQGVPELLNQAWNMLQELPKGEKIFEREFEFPEVAENLPYTVEKTADDTYTVEGPLIEKMLGYTNLDSEKGFAFFQKFLKERGIEDELKTKGIQEGDTVKMYGHEFEYFNT